MIDMVSRPEQLGLLQDQWERAQTLLEQAVCEGALMGAVMQVARHGKALPVICVGRRQLSEVGARVEPKTVFLIASITKPIVCAMVMRLVEKGRVCLQDCAADYLPAFGNRGKEHITLQHLLTHTSGLPDMVPENQALRQAHQPLSVFVEKMYDLELLFQPGRDISYQSCGIAILAAVVEQVEGQLMPDLLQTHIFEPLGLKDSALGRREIASERISEIMMPAHSDAGSGGTDWDWNSDFWHGFGAPWGGMFTTAEDLTVLCQTFLQGGQWQGHRILGEATVQAMARDQTGTMPTLPMETRLGQRWGLGWRLQDASLYGDLVSPQTFGHGGATGTVAWMDPKTGVSFVLLTNQADAARVLRPRLSNVIASGVVS